MSRTVEDWLFPAGTFAGPVVSFVGAHYGAGTSTWAALLGGADLAQRFPDAGMVIAVCRSTPAGITAAKDLVRQHGVARFKAFLVVADAAGKMLPQAGREAKVLSGAVPVVLVPWLPKLRGLEAAPLADVTLQRAAARIRQQLAVATVRVPKEFQAPKKENRA